MNPSEFDEIQSRLAPLFAKHRVLRAIVFGSFGRGEESRHSDLDLLVVQETEKRFLDRYDELLCPLAEAVPGRAVDLLIYTPREFECLQERPFIGRALREGKLIYERDQKAA